MARMKKMKAGKDGWCDWQLPIMDGYRMGCCDCGLVHDMQFQVVKIVKQNKDGSFVYKELDSEKYRVSMRGRRNNRSTAAVRRHKGKARHAER